MEGGYIMASEKIVMNVLKRQKLCKKYGKWNVSRALNYKASSLLAQQIRQEAINELGGIHINI